MPKYQELKVSAIWDLVKDDEEIRQYFPEYEPGNYPERDNLFAILSSLRKRGLLQLIKNAKNNRSFTENTEEDEMVQITPAIKTEIFNVLPRKSKLLHTEIIRT